MVYFKDAISSILLDTCNEPDIFMRKLRDIVEPIRDAIGKHENTFEGEFNIESQINSVPMILLNLVSMLVHGANIENKGFSQGALTAAQIIIYNFRKNAKKHDEPKHRRHLKERETPVVIYNSFKLYLESRSKLLLEEQHDLGFGLSYLRTIDITTNLYNSIRSQFERDDVLVPRVLKKNIFTVMAKDNIDLNAKSTMVKSHYHGTSISVFQFPSRDNSGDELERIYTDDSS